jgi:hypothetical protein
MTMIRRTRDRLGALVLVAAVVLIVGIGFLGASRRDSASPAASSRPTASPASFRSSQTFVTIQLGGSGVKAAHLAVFRRPRRSSDRVPSAWIADFTGLGVSISTKEIRRLASHLRPGNKSVIAAPASDGSVCLSVEPNGGGGCSDRLSSGGDINGTFESPGGGGAIFGLVEDGVRRVDVYVHGQRRRAQLGENVYYYGFGGKSDAPQRIVFVRGAGMPLSYGVPAP